MEKVQSSCVCDDNDPEPALRLFINYFMKIVNGHAENVLLKQKKPHGLTLS